MADQALHCVVRGSGPDLVVLHPAGLDHSFMGGLAEAASASHRVISVDLRGHGASPPANAATTLATFVQDLHELLATHCQGPARVLGLSFGGMIAQMLALDHPGDVSALVLCGCAGSFPSEVRPVLRARGTSAMEQGMEAIVAPTIERWFTPSFIADPQVERVRNRLRRDQPSDWSAVWHAIATLDALPRLGGLNVPTAVIAGERDVATPPAASEALAAAIPGAQFILLTGAPHMMQIECPQAFNAAALGFLSRCGDRLN